MEQTEANETTNITICIESLRSVGGHTRSVESYLAGLVEQRGVQGGGASVGGGQERLVYVHCIDTALNEESLNDHNFSSVGPITLIL